MSGMAEGFLYCTLLAGALALAAHWLEAALRGVGRPGRWGWFAAMLLSLVVPLAAWLGLRAWAAPLPTIPTPAFALPELNVIAAQGSGPTVSAVHVLIGAWVIGSAAILLRVLVGIGRLRSAMRGWRTERVSGIDVLVTEDVGPAVFGLRRASILLPAWALGIQEDLRALMLLHEREHMRAGDPWMLAGALGLIVLMPWNAALWYQLHRLRLAVEMDCDARVLRQVPDTRRYGSLLLEVGRRRSAPLGVLALSAPVTFLERRIHAFTRRAGPHAARRALALGAAAFCLGSLAVCARDPLSPEPALSRADAEAEIAPRFTPYTVKPQLRNPAQIAAALQGHYPALLRDAGISGTTTMWFYIDERGSVVRSQVHRSSGHSALDDAALRVAELMQFTPALNRDQPVPVWVQIPITFRPIDAEQATASGPVTASEPAPPAAAERQETTSPTSAGPHFTPYTEKPSLINAEEVSRALQRNYPPLLRDAGISGTATLWFHIADDGTVADVRVDRSSGHDPLDQAAVRVAQEMRFTPAKNGGEPVAVWVLIPVTFSSR